MDEIEIVIMEVFNYSVYVDNDRHICATSWNCIVDIIEGLKESAISQSKIEIKTHVEYKAMVKCGKMGTIFTTNCHETKQRCYGEIREVFAKGIVKVNTINQKD